jgi:hypothetical protein
MAKHIKVADSYRTNPLSHQPGGNDVTLYTRDGLILTYDKIKSPKSYISGLAFREDIVRIEIDGQPAWSSEEPGVRYWER